MPVLKKRTLWIACFLLLLVITVCCISTPQVAANPLVFKNTNVKSEYLPVQVISVENGDTFRALVDGKERIVRLACVSPPETEQQPFGKAATDKLKELLPIGKTVSLRVIEVDKHDRVIAEVFRSSTPINLQMVQEGFSVVYQKYLNGCPDRREQLLKAETEAQQQRKAFWSQPNPIVPAEFR